MIRHAFVLFAVVMLVAADAAAQREPNVALGFQAEQLYDFGDLDAVNLFNGNVVVTIPLGPKYTVGSLTYQFRLVHNSFVWDFKDVSTKACPGAKRGYGSVGSNAGLGWRISLGNLIPPTSPSAEYPRGGEASGWIYESPTGDTRVFSVPVEGTGGYYSRDANYSVNAPILPAADGSGLRLRYSGTDRIVEFPNGEQHIFRQVGTTTRWRLTRIEDAFTNGISMTYFPDVPDESTVQESRWEIAEDSGTTARVHSINFERTSLLSHTDYKGDVVANVDLSAPSDSSGTARRASYVFVYEEWDLPQPVGHYTCEPPYPPRPRKLLKSVTLPPGDATSTEQFVFDYHKDGRLDTGAIKASATSQVGKP